MTCRRGVGSAMLRFAFGSPQPTNDVRRGTSRRARRGTRGIGIHGFDRRDAVADARVVDEGCIERCGQREAAEQFAVGSMDRRRAACDVRALDEQHEHIVHAVAMDTFGCR